MAWLIGAASLPATIVFDPTLSALARGADLPQLVSFLAAVTWFGYGLIDVGLFLGLAVFAWWRADKARTIAALYAAGVVTGAGLLDQVVKNVACRARPGAATAGRFFAEFPCFAHGYALASFPSGHATTAFAAAVIIALWYPRAALPALALAMLVAVSRIFLGAHFPSDALAGALLGSGVVIVAYRLLPRLREA